MTVNENKGKSSHYGLNMPGYTRITWGETNTKLGIVNYSEKPSKVRIYNCNMLY